MNCLLCVVDLGFCGSYCVFCWGCCSAGSELKGGWWVKDRVVWCAFWCSFVAVVLVEDMGHRNDKKKRKERSRHGRKRRDSESEESGSGSDESDRSDSPKFTEEELREYLAKKAQKKALKVAKRLKTSSVSGYSNDSNPFGDSNLTERFVWRKKIERDLTQGLTPSEMSLKSEKKRQRDRMAEIEKVKKRREERAIEKAQHEEEMALLARERARAEYQDWQKKEEEFHFEQSKVRSDIRLREGRAKPIDILSKNLNLSEDFDVDVSEPYKIYRGLTVKEMEELRQDIKMHLELDRATNTHIEFWESMMVVCDWEIAQTRKRDALDRARLRGEEPPHELLAEDLGLHGVDDEVDDMLKGLSVKELNDLQEKTESKMQTGTAQVVEYWEAVLKRLHIYKAKARLREIHQELLRKHLKRIKYVDETRLPSLDRDEIEIEEEKPTSDWEPEVLAPSSEPVHDPQTEDEEDAGNYSPEPVNEVDGAEILDPEADKAELERKRAEVLDEQQRRLQEAAARPAAAEEDPLELTPLERASVMKSMGGMEDGDTMLGPGSEVSLESQVYWWHDKYRPRKPKYFNRVHTGYEWNKYNQTHYDHDNPPPKIVQGYKFNIFYPDLVDKTKAPTYFIERDGSNGETCLIRFHAGPPYEDIAFRIVNKEWEYSHKKGFKCTFERGILHVYFNFKRYRYRR